MTSAVALLLATGIGLLIGLERGWRHRAAREGERTAGIRTFALLGLGGGLAGLATTQVAPPFGPLFGLVTMAALCAVVVIAHRARLAEADRYVSATNAVTAVVTLLLGLLATAGYPREALIAGGSVALILSMREELHAWLRTLSEKDVTAVAQYGAITLVALPLLPDRAMGPYDALNPRMLWMVVVFVTGLSFAGYWAAKRFGPAKGMIVASAIGATYSSTAVTLDLARRLRSGTADRATLQAGIAAATALMPVRTLVLCAVVAPQALAPFALRIGPAVLAALAYAAVAILRAARHDQSGEPATPRNPFDFWPAVGFAALVAAIVVIGHWTTDRFGSGGAMAIIGFTGLYDVDAALIAAANLLRSAPSFAAVGALFALPVLANTLVKLALVLVLAGPRRGLAAAAPLLMSALLMGGALLLPG